MTLKWEALHINSAGVPTRTNVILSRAMLEILKGGSKKENYLIPQIAMSVIDSRRVKILPANGKDFELHFYTKAAQKKFKKTFAKFLKRLSMERMESMSRELLHGTPGLPRFNHSLPAPIVENKRRSNRRSSRHRSRSVTFGRDILKKLPIAEISKKSDAKRNRKKHRRGKSRNSLLPDEEDSATALKKFDLNAYLNGDEKDNLGLTPNGSNLERDITIGTVGQEDTLEENGEHERQSGDSQGPDHAPSQNTARGPSRSIDLPSSAELLKNGRSTTSEKVGTTISTRSSLHVSLSAARIGRDREKIYKRVKVLVALHNPDGNPKSLVHQTYAATGRTPISWDEKMTMFSSWEMEPVPGDYITFRILIDDDAACKTNVKLGRDAKSGKEFYKWIPLALAGENSSWQIDERDAIGFLCVRIHFESGAPFAYRTNYQNGNKIKFQYGDYASFETDTPSCFDSCLRTFRNMCSGGESKG